MFSIGNRVRAKDLDLEGRITELQGRDMRVQWEGKEATWEVAESLERVYKFQKVRIKTN